MSQKRNSPETQQVSENRAMKVCKSFEIVNFRGKAYYVRKDTIEMIPYMDSLFNGPMKNSDRDSYGNLVIAEAAVHFFLLVDYYRGWLQKGSPTYIKDCYRRGLMSSIAERMGMPTEFVTALLNEKQINEIDLYRCYYCHKIFTRNGSDRQRECRYHAKGCTCRHNYSKCESDIHP